MSTIQLLVVDLDGTTVGESNQIESVVQQAIQAAQAQGVQVAIATGRMYRSALRFHETLGSTLPLMAYQGALIKNPTDGKLLRHWTVDQDRARQLLDYFEAPEVIADISVHFYIDDQLYVREITAETVLYSQRSGVDAIAVGDLRTMLDADLTKILVQSADVPLINRLLADLRQRYAPDQLYFTKSVDTFLEAANPGVNKGVAVRYLAEELLGLTPDQVMTIGDNFNDVEMIQYAGTGIAMGNAPADVQAIADWVAPTVAQHGVAVAIEKFVL